MKWSSFLFAVWSGRPTCGGNERVRPGPATSELRNAPRADAEQKDSGSNRIKLEFFVERFQHSCSLFWEWPGSGAPTTQPTTILGIAGGWTMSLVSTSSNFIVVACDPLFPDLADEMRTKNSRSQSWPNQCWKSRTTTKTHPYPCRVLVRIPRIRNPLSKTATLEIVRYRHSKLKKSLTLTAQGS